jgi:UDP-glucuronate 4-epimerase
MKILVTGAAGFIGYHLSRMLVERGDEVIALDNLSSYYDRKLKLDRLAQLGIRWSYDMDCKIAESFLHPNFRFIKADITDKSMLLNLFEQEHFDKVCNLAGQAGVRYSIENPDAYIQNNIIGFYNVLECCRQCHVHHLIFASSSSVYGSNTVIPFSEQDKSDSPVSFYAATKKSDEVMAYAYSHLYGISVTGLRYFTVYGPWGRPDMSPMLFANAIRDNHPIKVFNYGDMSRDFTFIDDIVEGTAKVLDKVVVPFGIYNIGRGEPIKIMDFIQTLERELGSKAKIQMMPMQDGDVRMTYADTTALKRDFGYSPRTSLEKGIHEFVEWYRHYDHINVYL